MSSPLPATPALLRFCCGHCGMMLEAPPELAGVSGPCPTCAEEVMAPVLAVADAPLERPTQPPPRVRTDGIQDFPWSEPEAFDWTLPADTAPPAAAEPAPAAPADWDPVAAATGVENFLPAPVTNLRLRFPSACSAPDHPAWLPEDRTPRRPAPEPDEPITFSESAWPEGESDSENNHDPADDLEDDEAAPHKRNRLVRFFDAALIIAFIGTLVLAGAAFTFTERRPAGNAIPNLTESVATYMQQLEKGRIAAAADATQTLRLFTGARHVKEMENYLLHDAGDPPPLPFPCFPGRTTDEFSLINTRRIPDTERFLTTFELPAALPVSDDGITTRNVPVIVPVEEVAPGISRIHGLALDQQLNSRFGRFLATTEGSGVFYTQIRPCPPAQIAEFEKARQDLREWVAIDVLSAFPMAGEHSVIAFIEPSAPAATVLRRRSPDSGLLRAVITLTWRNHAESGPFIELVKFEANAWSHHLVDE